MTTVHHPGSLSDAADRNPVVAQALAAFEAERARLAGLIGVAQQRLDRAMATSSGLPQLDELITGAHEELAKMECTYRTAIASVVADADAEVDRLLSRRRVGAR